MRRTLATAMVALVATASAVTATPGVVSAAADARATPTVLPAQARAAQVTDRERATAALDRAKALFSHGNPGSGPDSRVGGSRTGGTGPDETGPDATMVLRDLALSLDDLSPSQHKVAQAILARPTDPKDKWGDSYSVKAVRECGGHFCIHWVRSTQDAPPNRAWVDQMLGLMNKVWKKEVGKLGYRHPVTDGRRGGNRLFDVYLAQLGDEGLYGYCVPERSKPGLDWVTDGYCVLDNDMSEFPRAPIDNAKVTVAHEFFHAIQFAYDYGEDVWMMESTATWMEEQVFDGINDNRQFLVYGQVVDPNHPLDYWTRRSFWQYGNWPFWELFSHVYGKGAVRKVWNQIAFTNRRDLYSMQGITSFLRPRGGFKKFYSRYVSANLAPAAFYPEGAAWPSTRLFGDFTLTSDQRHTDKHGRRLLHLTSASYAVRPSPSLASTKWRLRVKIDGPKRFRMPAASVLVVRNGGVDRHFVRLNRRGNGKVVVPFGQEQVQAVYVSLVNASTRYRCGRTYYYACQGLPIDDTSAFTGQRYKFSATAFLKG